MSKALRCLNCRQKTLFSVVKVFYYAGKIYGLAPYSLSTLQEQANSHFSNVIVSVLIFLGERKRIFVLNPKNTLILGISTSTIYAYLASFSEKIANKPKLYFMYELIQGLKVFSTVAIILQILLKRKKFIKACSKLHEVDLLVEDLKKTLPNYSGCFALSLTCVCIPFLHLSLIGYYDYLKNNDFSALLVRFLTERLQQEINLFITFYYLFYVGVLYRRFVFINEVLVNFNSKKRRCGHALFLLKTVAKMHENLCTGARYFNDVFSLALFFIIICQVSDCFLLLYMIYRGSEWSILLKGVIYVLQTVNIMFPTRLTSVEVSSFLFLCIY